MTLTSWRLWLWIPIALALMGGASAAPSPTQREWAAANCPLGMPKPLPSADLDSTRIIAREGYVLQHSAVDKIPLWVCERITKQQVTGPLSRPKRDPFKPDPDLPKGSRAELSDYRGSGYDRGHQAPSGDQTVDRRLQEQTFYLSNMCPQSAELNRKIWQELEQRVRGQAKRMGAVYVITGPMFYEEAEEDDATADGRVQYLTIGAGNVAVPTHFYKIVLWKDPDGAWQAVAFVMENRKAPFSAPYDFKKYVRPIRWIEQWTGFDFDPDLPAEEADRLEKAPGRMWN